jgi:hypothetical protein
MMSSRERRSSARTAWRAALATLALLPSSLLVAGGTSAAQPSGPSQDGSVQRIASVQQFRSGQQDPGVQAAPYCAPDHMCLFSEPNFTGQRRDYFLPGENNCGTDTQPIRSLINTTQKVLVVHPDGGCKAPPARIRETENPTMPFDVWSISYCQEC